MKVQDLELCLRTRKILQDNGILYTEQLADLYEAEVSRFRGFGKKCWDDLTFQLNRHSLPHPKRYKKAGKPFRYWAEAYWGPITINGSVA